MPVSTLPPDLISLIQHVELNKADWLGAATKRFILTALWASSKPLKAEDISQELATRFSVTLPPDIVARHADSLTSTGVLMRITDGQHFKISEQALKEFSTDLESATQIQADAKSRFTELIGKRCPSLPTDEVWSHFSEDFLLPLVREMGARTYELLAGSPREIPRTGTFLTFLSGYSPDLRQILEQAIVEFLDPKVPSIRAYLLCHLNAFFLLEATSLADSTLKAISALTQTQAEFTVFVDTNFLFSILALHDNPGNDAASALLSLTKSLTGRVSVKFYVTPITLDETRGVITWYRDALRNVRLTPNTAYLVRRGQISGIGLKFAQECIRLNRSLDADDYFGPYVDNLLEIVRSKGIELYNENLDQYRSSQEVIDDVVTQLKFEKERFGNNAKSYEQLMHDVCVWSFVKAKRAALVESVVDAKYWLTTLDFGLLRFDAYKRRMAGNDIALCIHPAALVQMLQFWIPRTPEFEEAIVASIRYPFFFYQFDAAAERATIRIIEAVTRFEGVGDLPKETIGRIFVDQALRGKIAVERDPEKRVELVKEALIREAVTVKGELETAERQIRELETALAGKADRVSELEVAIRKRETDITNLDKVTRSAQQGSERERAKREELERRIEQLEAETRRKESQNKARDERVRFRATWVFTALPSLLLLAVGATAALAYLGRRGLVGRWVFWLGSIALWAVLLLLWAALVDRNGSGMKAVATSAAFIRFQRIKGWIFGALGVVLLGVMGNGVWKWIEHALVGP